MTAVRVNPCIVSMVAVLVCLAAAVGPGQPPDVLSKPPDWQPADPNDVKARALAWLEENKAANKSDAEATIAKATQLWANIPEQPTGAELLAGLAKTFAMVDENAAGLVRLCDQPKSQPSLPDQSWLTDAKTPPLLSGNMRLLYGRWLIHQELFDESLEQIADLDAGEVVAPALLLFCQGAANHTLLQKEAGLQAIERLLDGAQQSPRRYVVLARLMQQDLQGLEDDTLDHIARRMGDIRRRLDLGRAGEKVQQVERGVIESLDKLIKKLEEQQKKGQSSSSASNNIRSNSPAQRSQIIGGKGPGEVTRRRIGSESGWGDLPPKQREEALQRIGRDFPSHYRDVIEQYFRRLAAEDTD